MRIFCMPKCNKMFRFARVELIFYMPIYPHITCEFNRNNLWISKGCGLISKLILIYPH